MSDPIEEIVSDLQDRYYPGSRTVRRAYADDSGAPARPAPDEDEERWDENPRVYPVNGEDVEFFTIGALAKALDRSPVTIREWERLGIIPKARFQIPGSGPRGRRRLYTREQIEGIVKIAREEGVLGSGKVKDFTDTNFTAKVVELFQVTGLE